ncbi:class I SAM-dependent methyltransferase [Leptolyngbya sp. FACHB-541]|uniref:class I SAM-dependent methyltransferase n=1 Tax=Leptolyngbya sp. FACHB-541 TaxID=2692810 RepID=UPI0016827DBA|nr:class I SAM-dependent methyltransferase [Leptolyngbya sp. FACHB-541]MBD1997799.1 class I SAM-dependent methyltransferase [Leptolyngbya sp. FACHB-541]
MLNSLAIVVPVYNCERFIQKTLESIESSLDFFRQNYNNAAAVSAEIVVVNDASSDNTEEAVNDFIQQKSSYKSIYKVTRHSKSLGAGPARNTGVRISTGEILFFCDGDDLFLKEHIYVCYKALSQEIPIQPEVMPTNQVAVVKTKAKIQEQLHPHWRAAIDNSLLINLCLRRDCHEFVEGFPEAAVYKQIRGREDTAYLDWIGKFFKVFRADLETVEYVRYPGNSFDRQLKKFQTPPEDYQLDWTPEENKLHAIATQLESEKTLYLFKKLYQLDQRFIPTEFINWQPIVAEYLAQEKWVEAIAFYQQSSEIKEAIAAEHKNALARAYNNLGTALHQQKELDQAIECFQQAIALQPDFSKANLARICFNAGMVLLDQEQLQQALALFQQACEADPHLTQAQYQLSRTRYQLQVQSRGYQFTQDWFSNNILVWEQHLLPLAGRNLQVLEIGSWEGRSTCWLLDHILTHGSAQVTCIDTFQGSAEHSRFDADYVQSLESRFDANIAKTGVPQKVQKQIGQSQEKLRSLPLNTYDLLYIDGSHIASDVLEDALLGWRLVKARGLIVFDDYGFSFDQNTQHNPKAGIDAFLTIFRDKIKITHKSYQVFVEKLTDSA